MEAQFKYSCTKRDQCADMVTASLQILKGKSPYDRYLPACSEECLCRRSWHHTCPE
jgi:hypothetical protein